MKKDSAVMSIFLFILCASSFLFITKSDIVYENYKSLGILSMVLLISAAFFIITRWKGNEAMSFSQYAAKHRGAYFVLALSLTITLSMFYLFIINWFVPKFGLTLLFPRLLAVGIISELIAAWIPDTKGLSMRIHNFFVTIVTFVIWVLPMIISLSSGVPFIARVISSIVVICMTAILLILFSSRKARYEFFYFQSAYVFVFQIAVMAATYMR